MEVVVVRSCLRCLKFSGHAVKEMLSEEFGEISEAEVREVLDAGEIIEDYPADRPIASCLVHGRTKAGRPLHVVCAPLPEEGILVIITVYEPDPAMWIDFKRRKK